MSIDTTIEGSVSASLDSDPRIPDPSAIAISVTDGTVTMRGTVGSFSQHRAALRDARNTPGVYDTVDEIDVRLMNDARRKDADIRGIALQILIWDTRVPAELVEVTVKNGWVRLNGVVNYQFQTDAAYDDVSDLNGVVGVTNEITVINP